MRRLIALVLLVLFVGGLVGCGTVEGVGKDVETTGQAIQPPSSR